MANLSNINNKFIVEDSGDVGIGVTAATSKLHLRDPGVNSDVGIKIGNDSRDWNLKVMGSVSDSLQFFTHDNSNVMTILPSGNVGIGTNSPDAKLHIYGSSSLSEMYLGEDAAADKAGILKYTQGDGSGTGVITLSHWGNTSTTQSLAIKYGGNVGIGTISPQANLHIDANSGILTQEILKVKGGGSGGAYGFLVEANNGDDLFKVDTSTYNCYFPSSFTKVGIGTDSPNYGKLQIDQTAGNNLTLRKGIGYAAIAFGGVTNNEATFLIEGNANQGFKIYNGTGTLASPTWTAGMDFYDGGRLYPYGGVFLGSSNTSNLLNDYEEGTWTPTIVSFGGAAATLSTANGTFTKIGRKVFLNYDVRMSSKASMTGAYVLLGGLPFNHPTTHNGTGTIDFFNNMTTAFSSMAWDTTSTGNVCWLVGVKGTSATSSVYVTVAEISDTTQFKGTIIYHT